MFPYSDPAGRNFLGLSNVQDIYRQRLQGSYEAFARRPNSAFTWIEAFSELAGGQAPSVVSVDWRAFPLTSTASEKVIDSDRLTHQDEYVEWFPERKSGKLSQVIFTTEFPEYFQAFAEEGLTTLATAIQDVMPGANPTEEELFGANFNVAAATPRGRSEAFRNHLPDNPWNNGEKGILCLTQGANTLGALFNLLTACGVRSTGTVEGTCALVGGACGPGRSSDPAVCAEAQRAARNGIGFTLRDPAGVRIVKLEGQWELNNAPLEINNANQNQGIWTVSRNGRRAVLKVSSGLTLDGQAISSGAQASRKVNVAADLLAAPNAALPNWARVGQESGSRGPQS